MNPRLQWVQIKEFGGLWTTSDRFLMPANAAQVMSGCHPQPSGGLRAFYKAQTAATTLGLQEAADVDSRTIFGHGIIRATSQVPFVFVLTHSTTPVEGGLAQAPIYKNQQLWVFGKRFSTVGGFDAFHNQWWEKATSGVVFNGDDEADQFLEGFVNKRQPAFVKIGFSTLQPDSTVLPEMFLTVNNGVAGDANTDQGLFELTASLDTVVLARTALGSNGDAALGPAVVHQSRLVFAAANGLMWSEPGGTGIPATIGGGDNWTVLSASDPTFGKSFPAWMVAVPPSDLLVGNFHGDVFNLQGDIDDADVREIGRWASAVSHRPVNTPYGPAVILAGFGPTLLGLDGSYEHIAEQLDDTLWHVDGNAGGYGDLDFVDNFLFAPNQHEDEILGNGALVFDFRTKAWFTSAHPDHATITNPRWLSAEEVDGSGGLIVYSNAPITTTVEPLLYRYDLIASETGEQNRAPVWEWRSAPIRGQDGRRLEVREIHLGTNGMTAAGTMEITVTSDTGATQTRTIDCPDGRADHTLAFRLSGEYVDVTVKSLSNDPDGEAPMLDGIEIGFASRQRVLHRNRGGYRNGYAEGY